MIRSLYVSDPNVYLTAYPSKIFELSSQPLLFFRSLLQESISRQDEPYDRFLVGVLLRGEPYYFIPVRDWHILVKDLFIASEIAKQYNSISDSTYAEKMLIPVERHIGNRYIVQYVNRFMKGLIHALKDLADETVFNSLLQEANIIPVDIVVDIEKYPKVKGRYCLNIIDLVKLEKVRNVAAAFNNMFEGRSVVKSNGVLS